LVVSFGKIVPKNYLDTPKIGTFNIHFSLLPKYRGALCISEAIKNQDKITGVTLMEMDELLDHGPVISQVEIPIDITDNTATLTTKLTQTAITLLADKLPEICAQIFHKTAQDETKVVFTPSHRTISRQSAFIPFDKILIAQNGIESSALHALIRSLNPDPGAWTTINNIDVKILDSSLSEDKLILNTVQLSGKSPISWKQFLSGHPIT
jgi:methionyl-tRNA formyltransferase